MTLPSCLTIKRRFSCMDNDIDISPPQQKLSHSTRLLSTLPLSYLPIQDRPSAYLSCLLADFMHIMADSTTTRCKGNGCDVVPVRKRLLTPGTVDDLLFCIALYHLLVYVERLRASVSLTIIPLMVEIER